VSALASEGGHTDPVASVALRLALILILAKLGGDLATRLRQPAVLGELLAGVLLGNLDLIGVRFFEPLATDQTLDMLARVGILLLLFEVGLESTVGQMLKVGVSSFLVAILGVSAPFALGYLAAAALLPAADGYVHAFIGATLTATSVGITARVLRDLGRSQTPEARIILGAAVIDDVLGLVILAVVSGAIAAAGAGGTLSLLSVAAVLGKSVGFLVAALVLGVYLSPRLFHLASGLHTRGVLLAMGLSFCFLLSYLANWIGLAPIVGAFAAGLILEDTHYKDFLEKGEHTLEHLIHPISSFLVPVFFVLMGMRTDLRAFGSGGVLLLAAALIVIAIGGKLLCGLGARGAGLDRLTIGIGMVPRGEVGLIFVSIGRELMLRGQPVVSEGTFSAVVIMVIVTTMITPPALTWSMNRR
jgi:Kef-type K+ transport system membrane component KefB